MALFLFLLFISPCFCQANTNTANRRIHLSINMESDDSGSGDRTYTISLATADALSSNKSVHIKAGDFLRAKDNGGFALLTNEMDYLNCNSSNPLYLFYGNNASHTLKNSGTFYIISLEADLCNNGAKEIIKVREKESTPASPHQTSSSSSAGPSSGPNIPLIVGSAFFAIICVFSGVLCGCWYCC